MVSVETNDVTGISVVNENCENLTFGVISNLMLTEFCPFPLFHAYHVKYVNIIITAFLLRSPSQLVAARGYSSLLLLMPFQVILGGIQVRLSFATHYKYYGIQINQKIWVEYYSDLNILH